MKPEFSKPIVFFSSDFWKNSSPCKNIRTLLFALLFIFLSSSCWAATVAILQSSDDAYFNEALAGIKEVVSADTHIIILEGNLEHIDSSIKKIRSKNPEVIVAIGPLAVRTAREKIPGIPLVYCMCGDCGAEFFGTYSTGVILKTTPSMEFSYLRDTIPRVKKIGVLYNKNKIPKKIDEARSASADSDLKLIEAPFGSEKEIMKALKKIISGIDLLWIIPDWDLDALSMDILDETYRNNIPVMIYSGNHVKKGALMSLEPDFREVGRQTGHIVNKILKGSSLSSVRPESPKAFKFYINTTIAKKIGITIPDRILTAKNTVLVTGH
jgi:putative tryptophan/tyrosine transport system substrate-binding protein